MFNYAFVLGEFGKKGTRDGTVLESLSCLERRAAKIWRNGRIESLRKKGFVNFGRPMKGTQPLARPLGPGWRSPRVGTSSAPRMALGQCRFACLSLQL